MQARQCQETRKSTPNMAYLSPNHEGKGTSRLQDSMQRERPIFQIQAPRVTHTVAVLLLGLHFFTEDLDCVNDTVDIFQFPDLSLSTGY